MITYIYNTCVKHIDNKNSLKLIKFSAFWKFYEKYWKLWCLFFGHGLIVSHNKHDFQQSCFVASSRIRPENCFSVNMIGRRGKQAGG